MNTDLKKVGEKKFMSRGLAWFLGAGLGANGVWMLIRPLDWYYTMPGVKGTGPPNLHFMRDIGCAYVVVCASLFWTAKKPRQAWPSVFTSGLFLALHALVHLWDTLAGRQPGHQLVTDLPGVVLPALLVLWVAWLAQRSSAEE